MPRPRPALVAAQLRVIEAIGEAVEPGVDVCELLLAVDDLLVVAEREAERDALRRRLLLILTSDN